MKKKSKLSCLIEKYSQVQTRKGANYDMHVISYTMSCGFSVWIKIIHKNVSPLSFHVTKDRFFVCHWTLL